MQACLRSTFTSRRLLSIRNSWRCLQFHTRSSRYTGYVLFFFVRTWQKGRLSEAIAFTVAVAVHSGIKKIIYGVMSRIEGRRGTIVLTPVIAGCKNPALKSKGEAMKVPTDLMRRADAASAIGEQHNVIGIDTESPLACHFVHTAYSRRGSMSKFLRAVYYFVLLCTASSAALGQLSTATAFGNITDSTGVGISNATVVFTQTQTNFTRLTKTNSQGEYCVGFLPVGPYTVSLAQFGWCQDNRLSNTTYGVPGGRGLLHKNLGDSPFMQA